MSRRSGRSLVACAIVVALALPLARVAAQESFYKGKTICLIVGLALGGGFDTYSRVIARHMGRHIPGNPILVVDNMPGAASLLADEGAIEMNHARPRSQLPDCGNPAARVSGYLI